MSIEEIKDEWNRTAWRFYTEEVTLKKGVREFLHELKKNNIKMGIQASTSSISGLIASTQISTQNTDSVKNNKSVFDSLEFKAVSSSYVNSNQQK